MIPDIEIPIYTGYLLNNIPKTTCPIGSATNKIVLKTENTRPNKSIGVTD